MKTRSLLSAAAALSLAALLPACTGPEVPPKSPAPAAAPAPLPTEGGLPAPAGAPRDGEPAKPPAPAPAKNGAFAPAVAPKPLGDSVEKGLAWILKRQQENGGWSQGEESAQMGSGLDHLRDRSNVADTCVAALALVRAGSTPSAGPHAAAIARALGFVMSEIEAADEKDLFITSIRGTRVQTKLGPYVDTFLGSMLLAETRGKMPDEAGNKRLAAALDKVMDKIERNQRTDGSWDNRGWAPVLSQGIAGKALVRAQTAGAKVNDTTLAKVEEYSRNQFDSASGFKGDGSAGVKLYAASANLGVMSESAGDIEKKDAEVALRLATTPVAGPERKKLEADRVQFANARTSRVAAEKNVLGQLDDQQFLSGFGSNGGEEFLSYMNISETLVVKGGADWEKWDKSMGENLTRIQNEDGSWSGHHCITGRTFCTAAALLVLTADRAPFRWRRGWRGGSGFPLPEGSWPRWSDSDVRGHESEAEGRVREFACRDQDCTLV